MAIPSKIGGNRYELVKKLGSGSFGDIYLAVNSRTQEQVAAKLEHTSAKHPQLMFEAKLMKYLAGEGEGGIPTILWFGKEGEYNIMVMELLGPTLEALMVYSGGKFTLKTVLMITQQMVSRVAYVHQHGFIHRDIKPENFLIANESCIGKTSKSKPSSNAKASGKIYLIDFGLAKRYKDLKSGAHAKFNKSHNLTGTARYASVNSHMGVEQSRRDDLESVAYIAFYFLRGALPWQGVDADSKQEKYKKIMEIKLATNFEALIKGIPGELISFVKYCKELRFEEEPNYLYVQRLLNQIFSKYGFSNDSVFDWTENLYMVERSNSLVNREETKLESAPYNYRPRVLEEEK